MVRTCIAAPAVFIALALRAYGQDVLGAEDRLKWVVNSTVGPTSLAGGAISAGWGTLFNLPSEYGTHWDGFGKRNAMRLTGVATSNVAEAGLGALWREDPRYSPAPGRPFKERVGRVVKMTFLDNNGRPAYARYLAVAGTNFASNRWRPDSEATTNRASLRIGLGFLGRMSGNAFQEFWPDVKRRVLRKQE